MMWGKPGPHGIYEQYGSALVSYSVEAYLLMLYLTHQMNQEY
uniref:Uncharacterized protein n=1 Tax=Arundo donax TaxID=35708 RepID=A0A0A9C5T3_ARUDO